MYDYFKLWIDDRAQVERVLKHFSDAEYHNNSEGLLKRITGTFKNFRLEYNVLYQRLQITGSIHVYWNGGTNENDFTFYSARAALQQLCRELEMEPALAKVINLEFGVNLASAICASTIIDQVICYNYTLPIRQYRSRPDLYYIEFEATDYYLKIYDKGKQYRERLPGVGNVLRIEAKAMKGRVIQQAAGIATLADLMNKRKMQVLGVKLATFLKGLVFDDDTINPKHLAKKDRRLYQKMINPKAWLKYKGNTTSGTGKKVRRFKNIVEHYGELKIYSLIAGAVNDKILQLASNGKVADFTPKYSVKIDTARYCLSCGRDISKQKSGSKYCSAKYIGYSEAHKCRNTNSNPRNNFERKYQKLKGLGLLFDVLPYFVKVPA